MSAQLTAPESGGSYLLRYKTGGNSWVLLINIVNTRKKAIKICFVWSNLTYSKTKTVTTIIGEPNHFFSKMFFGH